MSDDRVEGSPRGTVGEVFRVFLGLGLTSFGGPVAHLGYFRDAFVVRRRWLSEQAYADLVALCQFLPGPASSQVGMAIGLVRAGYRGLLAAWLAFTLPSVLLLVAFAYGAEALGDALGGGWVAGLKAAAAAVVAHAVLGMARSLAPDRERATLAVAAMLVLVLAPSTALAQVLVIVVGGLAGLLWLRPPEPSGDDAGTLGVRVGRRTAAGLLVVFAVLLVALPVAAQTTGARALDLVDGFYRAGSLVFGGGHVVLPLLDAETVQAGVVDRDTFLAGYGAAQAVPGPLFSFAAYLGAVMEVPPTGIPGATLALLAIYLPSTLLVLGTLPFWDGLRRAPRAQRALAGVGAAVVGLLAATLHDPVLTEGVTSPATAAIAVAGFAALARWRVPAWAVVLAASGLGLLLA